MFNSLLLIKMLKEELSPCYTKKLIPICFSCYGLIEIISLEITKEKNLYLQYKCDCLNKHKMLFEDYYYGLKLMLSFNHLFQADSCYYIIAKGRYFGYDDEGLKIYHNGQKFFMPICEVHDKNKNLFCLQCQHVICEECIGNHNQHQIQNLNDMYATTKEKFIKIVKIPKNFVINLLSENKLPTNANLKDNLLQLYEIFWNIFQDKFENPNLQLINSLNFLIKLKILPKKDKEKVIYKQHYLLKYNFISTDINCHEDNYFSLNDEGIHYEKIKEWVCLDNKTYAILFQGVNQKNKKICLIEIFDFYLEK